MIPVLRTNTNSMTRLEKINLFFDKGYTINKEGFVFNKKGDKVNGYLEKGYKTMKLRHSKNKFVRLYFHQIIAYLKFGDEALKDGIVTRHLNHDRLDSSWDNIEIGTMYDNIMDNSPEKRSQYSRLGSRVKQDRIRSFEERCKIYDMLYRGSTFSEIKKVFEVNKSGLYYMKTKSLEYKEYVESLTLETTSP